MRMYYKYILNIPRDTEIFYGSRKSVIEIQANRTNFGMYLFYVL